MTTDRPKKLEATPPCKSPYDAGDEHCRVLLQLSVPQVQLPHVQGTNAIGERRLILAILEDAIRCFQTYLFNQEKRGRTLFHEAEEWLAAEDSTLYFSFENICEVLGINAQSVRRSLHRWREQQLQRAGGGRSAAGTL